jgi:hypothetical protein
VPAPAIMPIVVVSSVTIELPYQGWAISKNGLWNGGDRRAGPNKEAASWKQTLVDWLGHYPFFHMRRYIVTPVGVEIGARCLDNRHRPDTHNLSELVCDGIQEGIGIDDKYFEVFTRQPEIGTKQPVVLVTVRVRMQV